MVVRFLLMRRKRLDGSTIQPFVLNVGDAMHAGMARSRHPCVILRACLLLLWCRRGSCLGAAVSGGCASHHVGAGHHGRAGLAAHVGGGCAGHHVGAGHHGCAGLAAGLSCRHAGLASGAAGWQRGLAAGAGVGRCG